jgi:phage tail sheath protein FI
VYTGETPTGIQPIAGVSTRTAAFVGATRKGPVNAARVVDSFAEFREHFGKASPDSPTALAVFQFYVNGGRKAVVVRVPAARARRDTTPTPKDLIGESKSGTGLHALPSQEEIGLLLTPDTSRMSMRDSDTVGAAALSFCDEHRVFHIMDVPYRYIRRTSAEAAADWSRKSKSVGGPNGAVYFPRLYVADPSRRSETLLVAPSGAVAGLYARTDTDRGVWKAPAGPSARLLGVKAVEIDLTHRDVDLLQRAAINPLRSFVDRGIVPGSEWKYVPVRRLMLLIEQSIERGLQWVVFEPNDEPLWAQIRLSVSSFMHHLFLAGALPGRRVPEAYFVKCGAETTTPSEIKDGTVNVLVGVAPLRPAEFVVTRITLKTSTS